MKPAPVSPPPISEPIRHGSIWEVDEEILAGEAEGNELAIDDEDDQEAEAVKIGRDPKLPSASEVEEHRISHFPFRIWCRECIEGRALGERRATWSEEKDQAKILPVVACDYFYNTSKGFLKREELEGYPTTADGESRLLEARRGGTIVKCIAIRCSSTKCVFAHIVPVKGLDEDGHVVRLVAKDVAWLGHTRLLMKCDNEPALKKLVEAALREVRVECPDLETVAKEAPERYDSQANGLVEVGIRNIRGLYRTHRLCLERRLGRSVPIDGPIASWLLEHVCFLTNALRKGADGLTPWTRCRGRAFRQHLIGFCETCLYKLPSKGPQHDAEGNMSARWKLGVFLGYNRESNAYLLANDDGVVTSRAVMRRPIENRWRADLVESITATPWSWRAAAAPSPRRTCHA